MSDIIHLLPDSVANQIAAGEVIQRPASVIKELVENAIDAQASEIHVLVTDAGKTCIQVIDNGCGMSPDEAVLCFERHSIRHLFICFSKKEAGRFIMKPMHTPPNTGSRAGDILSVIQGIVVL